MTTIARVLSRHPVLLGGSVAALLVFSIAAPGAAATAWPGVLRMAAVGGTADDATPPSTAQFDPVVERIQRALARARAYTGTIDGRMNAATEQAIRAYQKKTGQKVTGRPSEALANQMETDDKVNILLRRLERTREETTEAARQALLSHPATRDLIGERKDEVADPTRDFSPCFDSPTVSCLLAEASESAKAIAQDDLRDWALGEILAAQARAGLADAAMATARRIVDPRLVMVALRDIAEAQAAAGRSADAIEAAAIIPDPERQAEGFAAIAAIQARYDASLAVDTLGWLEDALKRVDSAFRRAALMARMAVVMNSAGQAAAARGKLSAAEALASGITAKADREAALRNVASAMAEIGDPDGALQIMKDVRNDSERTPVLVAAANAQADAGDAEGAMRIADSIEVGRYRAVVLSRIALAQLRGGNRDTARATMQKASEEAAKIDLPFARDFANSRIAMAFTVLAKADANELFSRSVEIAKSITDHRLRAQTLWSVATAERRAGQSAEADATEALADTATKEMKSTLSRVWMFGDIAMDHAYAVEKDAAWNAFAQGMRVAADIQNAWGRSRALSRMAVTLIELTEPGPGRRPVSE